MGSMHQFSYQYPLTNYPDTYIKKDPNCIKEKEKNCEKIKEDPDCIEKSGKNCTLIDIEAVKEAVQNGFLRYDIFFSDNINYDFACAQTIRLNNRLYHRNKNSLIVQDRTVYLDEFEETYLYRVSTIKVGSMSFDTNFI